MLNKLSPIQIKTKLDLALAGIYEIRAVLLKK